MQEKQYSIRVSSILCTFRMCYLDEWKRTFFTCNSTRRYSSNSSRRRLENTSDEWCFNAGPSPTQRSYSWNKYLFQGSIRTQQHQTNTTSWCRVRLSPQHANAQDDGEQVWGHQKKSSSEGDGRSWYPPCAGWILVSRSRYAPTIRRKSDSF